jgi:hypothetical protein
LARTVGRSSCHQHSDGFGRELAPFDTKPCCILSDNLAFDGCHPPLTLPQRRELDANVGKQTDRQRALYECAAYADVANPATRGDPVARSEENRAADLVPISPTVFHCASLPSEFEQ